MYASGRATKNRMRIVNGTRDTAKTLSRTISCYSTTTTALRRTPVRVSFLASANALAVAAATAYIKQSPRRTTARIRDKSTPSPRRTSASQHTHTNTHSLTHSLTGTASRLGSVSISEAFVGAMAHIRRRCHHGHCMRRRPGCRAQETAAISRIISTYVPAHAITSSTRTHRNPVRKSSRRPSNTSVAVTVYRMPIRRMQRVTVSDRGTSARPPLRAEEHT